jgi:hypothetical protein
MNDRILDGREHAHPPATSGAGEDIDGAGSASSFLR